MSPRTLRVLLYGETIGELAQDDNLRLRFGYDPDLRRRIEKPTPLSLSMPLFAITPETRSARSCGACSRRTRPRSAR